VVQIHSPRPFFSLIKHVVFIASDSQRWPLQIRYFTLLTDGRSRLRRSFALGPEERAGSGRGT
jgi:hypothetical protein